MSDIFLKRLWWAFPSIRQVNNECRYYKLVWTLFVSHWLWKFVFSILQARQVSSSHSLVNLYKPEYLLISATRSMGMQALKGSWFKGSVSSLKVLRLDIFYVVTYRNLSQWLPMFVEYKLSSFKFLFLPICVLSSAWHWTVSQLELRFEEWGGVRRALYSPVYLLKTLT